MTMSRFKKLRSVRLSAKQNHVYFMNDRLRFHEINDLGIPLWDKRWDNSTLEAAASVAKAQGTPAQCKRPVRPLTRKE
jgi:hypothetical protein